MQRSDAWILEEERILICEGDQDQFFLETLIQEQDLPAFQIKGSAGWNRLDVGGIEGFGFALEKLAAVTDFKKLKGIAIVTDNDKKGALENVKQKLQKHFSSLQNDYNYKTTRSKYIVRLNSKPVLIVLVPDNKNCGNLETLCLPVLYDHWSTAGKCVEEFLKCTSAIPNWTNNKLDKAKVGSIISGYHKDNPNQALGRLFQRSNELPTNHKCFDQLINILKHFDEIIEKGKLSITSFARA